MKKLCSVLVIFFAGCGGTVDGSGDVATDAAERQAGFTTLTDMETGRRITMESTRAGTLITDLETGDFIEVDEDLTGTMGSAEYTLMMHEKRTAEAEAALSGDAQMGGSAEEHLGPPKWFLAGSGTFSLSDSWVSPKYAKTGSKQVYTKLTATTYNPAGDSIRIELRRSVPWWFDTSYGTIDYWVAQNSGGGGTKYWTGATVAGDYYVRISKYYNGYWSKGTYSLSD